MIVDLDHPPRATDLDLSAWSAAEVLDTTLSGSLMLRGLVCRLGAAKWHWSVTSLDGERGELISAGIEKSIAAARMMVTTEITKCLGNPLE